MTNFEFEDDRAFFEALLCHEGEALTAYAELFDFRPPEVKRRDFAAVRSSTLAGRLVEPGAQCQLALSGVCTPASGWVIDHRPPPTASAPKPQPRSSMLGLAHFLAWPRAFRGETLYD